MFRSKLSRLLVLGLLFPASTFSAEISEKNKELAERGMNLGFAFGELITAAASEAKLPPADYGAENASKALEAMRVNYKREFTMQRAGVKLIDGTADLAITAVATSGMPGILMGSTLAYAKTKAMGVLSDEVDRNAKIYLAKNLDKFSADNGMDYATLNASGDAKRISDAIDKNGLLSDLASSMVGDDRAIETVRAAVVRNILTTQKYALDQIASTNANAADAKAKLTQVSKDLKSYSAKVDRAVEKLSTRATELETSMLASQKAIESLTERTSANTKDLRIVGDVLFSQSPPAQKLQLLKAGFYGSMDPANMKDLVTQLEGEEKKEKFVKEMQNVVGVVNDISTIAKNLNINLGPQINQAIGFANVAGQAVAAYMSGNPLGAVAAVSSLFGKGSSDPGAARHAAMMNYLKREFEEVNRKLVAIHDLQVQTIKAIGQLAENIANLQKQMHARFEALTYEVETIQMATRAMLYAGIYHCFDLRAQWREAVPSLRTVVIPNIDQLEAITPITSYDEVEKCLVSMRTLLAQATTSYSAFAQSPLAVRLANSSGATFPVPDTDKLEEYRSKVQSFEQGHYRPSYLLATQYSRARGTSSAALLWSYSLPARTVRDLDQKVGLIKAEEAFCIRKTLASRPIVNLLCPSNIDSMVSPELLSLAKSVLVEKRANERADSILGSAMLQEPIVDLVDLTLFFSAVAETQDPVSARRLANRREVLSATRAAQGPYMLASALKASTAAVAQGAMLYGDMTALIAYELLWNKAENRFRTLIELAGADEEARQRKDAYLLVKSNPYLLKNVVMIALDRSIGETRSSGEEISYRFSLAELSRTGEGQQLNLFFNNRMQFSHKTVSGCNVDCVGSRVVSVVDLDTPLPTWVEFSLRRLDYPPVVEKLERASDALANRIVAYDLGRATAKNSNVPLVDQALVLSTFGTQ